jgi:hypothetical protein
MINKLISFQMFSVSIDDFASLMNDNDGYPKVKTLESALGDDRMLSSETTTYQTGEVRVQGVGLIGITPIDLAKYLDYLKSGLFSRFVVLWIYLNKQENDDVARYISNGIGNYGNQDTQMIREKIVIDYYSDLFDIQFSKNKNIGRVRGYAIHPNIKENAFNRWKKILNNSGIIDIGNFKRDLHDFYRFLISNAFLNIYNRKCIDGILYPTEEDALFALELMEESLKNKATLFQLEDKAKLLQNPKKFLEFMEKNSKMREDIKKLLAFLSGHSSLLEKYETSKRAQAQNPNEKNDNARMSKN